jgi:hypothetical protein
MSAIGFITAELKKPLPRNAAKLPDFQLAGQFLSSPDRRSLEHQRADPDKSLG